MSLLDKFIERKKDYILTKDLLTNLSGMNNKPLYEIVNYLLCCDLNKLSFYYIDSSYRIEKVNSDREDHINDFLEVIKEAIRLGEHKDEALIYGNNDDLEKFSHFVRDRIRKVIDCRNNYYFNKTELLNFEPLDGLLHFDINDIPLPSKNNDLIIQMENRIGELLDELSDKDDKIKQLLNYSAPSKPNTGNRLINELKAKAELDQQIAEKKIADLESQLAQAKAKLADKPADDLKDVPYQSYRTIDRVMYAMAKLSNLDNREPYSQNNPSLNASITTILQNDGLTLEYQAVGKWLSRINDIKPLR
ncbi:hypothetical protein ACQKDP_07655 [Psychrobacter pacificensis]|uniref:hypothetical protein n=1 Tax=Psychrobacter pacificensis TaxID=112002 RepID=UPI003D0801C1